jgi:hypothetical protein
MSIGFVFCDVFGDVRFFRRAKGDLNLLTMRAHFVFETLEVGGVVGVPGGESTRVVMIAGARFLRTLGLSEVPGSEELRQKLHLRRSAGSDGGGRAVMLEEEGWRQPLRGRRAKRSRWRHVQRSRRDLRQSARESSGFGGIGFDRRSLGERSCGKMLRKASWQQFSILGQRAKCEQV